MAKHVVLALLNEGSYEHVATLDVDRPVIAVRRVTEEAIKASKEGGEVNQHVQDAKGFAVIPMRSFHRFAVHIENDPRVKVTEIDVERQGASTSA